MCAELGFKRIGVVYVNDNYGIYLTINILALAEELGISVSSVGYTQGDDEQTKSTIENAAVQLAELNVLVTVLIVHSGGSWVFSDVMYPLLPKRLKLKLKIQCHNT